MYLDTCRTGDRAVTGIGLLKFKPGVFIRDVMQIFCNYLDKLSVAPLITYAFTFHILFISVYFIV
jgi:hypothetical protein